MQVSLLGCSWSLDVVHKSFGAKAAHSQPPAHAYRHTQGPACAGARCIQGSSCRRERAAPARCSRKRAFGRPKHCRHLERNKNFRKETHAPQTIVNASARTKNDVTRSVGSGHAVGDVVEGGVELQHVAQHEVPRDSKPRRFVWASQPHFLAHGNVLTVALGTSYKALRIKCRRMSAAQSTHSDGADKTGPAHRCKRPRSIGGVVNRELMEVHKWAVEAPVQSAQLQQPCGRLGGGGPPCAQHAARGLNQLGYHVEVQDNGGVDTSAIGKALDFVEEVLRGKINIAARAR